MISRYIVEIISDGTLLYLPSVGTLYTFNDNIIYAPSDKGEDLVSILSSRYGMESAEQEYSQWLVKNCNEYEDRTEYTIEGFGTLRLFGSCATFILEGADEDRVKSELDSVAPAVQKESEPLQVALNDSAQEAIDAALSAAETAPEATYTINEEPEEDAVAPADPQRQWKMISIILLILLLLVSILLGYYFRKVSNIKHTTVVEVVRDTVYIEANQDSVAMTSIGRYHIVAGAFLNKNLADKMAESYIVRGYNAFVFFSEPKGYNMVSVITGDSVEELLPKISSLPKLEYDEPYWIYEYYIENK